MVKIHFPEKYKSNLPPVPKPQTKFILNKKAKTQKAHAYICFLNKTPARDEFQKIPSPVICTTQSIPDTNGILSANSEERGKIG